MRKGAILNRSDVRDRTAERIDPPSKLTGMSRPPQT